MAGEANAVRLQGRRGWPLATALARLGTWAAVFLAASASAQDAGADERGRGPAISGGGTWYTFEQARRGQGAYVEHCASCHSPDLRARSTYISLYANPALKGAFFWDRWDGQSVHTLLLVIEETMPLDAPGSLDGDTYADVMAFILEQNGFEPGNRELPPAAHDPGRLAGMVLERGVARALAQAQEVGAARRAPPADDEPPPPFVPAEEPTDDEEAVAPDEEHDGWFLDIQVERASTVFAERCVRCHGAALQGIGVAPSLAGENFLERWDGERVSDLFWVVRHLMPLDDQGTLLPETAADLVAFILARNGFEAGDRALPPDEAILANYVIERGETR
jgi:S-disulfanyl-L-cysteine oxidoreductase SoxD